MKRVLIVGKNGDTSMESATAFADTFKSDALDACAIEDILFEFDGQKLQVTNLLSGQDLGDYHSILFLGWYKPKIVEDVALAAGLYAASKNVRVLNSEVTTNRSKSKVSQGVVAVIHSIASIPFVFCLKSRSMLGASEKICGYPMIVKAPMASRGHDNYLVQNNEDLQKLLGDDSQTYIAQKYITNDGDYRLVLFGGHLELAIYRSSDGSSHVNNTSRGGTARLVPIDELPPQMVSQTEAIARHLRREITGVDMVIERGTSNFYFLEANNMPQLNSGTFVNEKMAALQKYLLESDSLKEQ